MKNTQKIIAASMLLMLSPITTNAETTHVVISSQMSPKARKSTCKALALYAFKELEPGNGIAFYCDQGDSVEKFASIEIPDYDFYRKNQAKKLEKIAPGIQKLKAWAKSQPAKREAYLSLNIPKVFAAMRNIKADPDGNTLLLLGSPVFHCKDRDFSMAENRFPSDSHMKMDRHQTPYSLLEAEKSLDGWVVRWAFLRAPFGDSTHYAARVERFWTIFCQCQGSTLAGFEVSLKNTITALSKDKSSPVFSAKPDFDTSFAMIRTKPRKIKPVSIEITEPEPPHTSETKTGLEFLTTEKLSQTPPQKLTVKSLKVAVKWQSNGEEMCDLDLYVKANPKAKELSFREQETPEGIHVKDIRAAAIDTYEIIELKQCDLSKIEIGVNVFAASGGDGLIPATIRLEVDGNVYSQDIVLRTKSGNLGTDRTGNREASKFWIVVDVLKVVGLR